MADELEHEIQRLGPEAVAAFIAEPVVGATTGAVPAVAAYFERVREICDRHGVLLILDEVMCGMGRTGTMHACTQEGIAPDLMTVAKGLGGGYQPIGAMLAAGKVYDAVARGSGAFMHGHTYKGHPVACAAGLAVLTTLREERLLENVVAMARHLWDRLHDRFGNHHHVGDVRGRGLPQAIELVADRPTKHPFEPGLKLHARIKREAIARPAGLSRGRHDRRAARRPRALAPPDIAGAADIDTIVERLGEAVDAAIASLATGGAKP